MPPTCATCRYWDKDPTGGGDFGWCHRYPPQLLGKSKNYGEDFSLFPLVMDNEWCGEHHPLDPQEPACTTPTTQS